MTDKNDSFTGKSNNSKTTTCTNTSCCPPQTPIIRATPKVGRNDPCICGNGLKYKKCCGKNA
ncbi:SEC-C metal-binding domain-containing protein [Paraglaciecola aquimarina]|uniref:SEC-C metal-binding domain-containing protein n=1 Tax=Paraglaciecola aquimarina TaxID=1235557 RepID=A0ABU3T1Y0_9ALTE|nr:SEC-C metal-binding domain-containing protein [Paraglaciecola aquimarina]MDU0356275.1 SEC-C metal-binding domain-containing protein [Paraglaciecola aquimarina]